MVEKEALLAMMREMRATESGICLKIRCKHRVRRRIEGTRLHLLSWSAGSVREVPGLGAKGGKIRDIFFVLLYLNHVVM
jgi:hypothetical protein